MWQRYAWGPGWGHRSMHFVTLATTFWCCEKAILSGSTLCAVKLLHSFKIFKLVLTSIVIYRNQLHYIHSANINCDQNNYSKALICIILQCILCYETAQITEKLQTSVNITYDQNNYSKASQNTSCQHTSMPAGS